MVKGHDIKHLVFKDFQLIIPDLRKYRKPNTDTTTKYPIMGQTQMKELDDIVKNTPINIQRTYYVSTTPLVGVKLARSVAVFLTGDATLFLDDYTSSGCYSNERRHIMNKLFELSKVVVVGGDYHCAEHHTCVKGGKVINTITTSPISSDPVTLRSPFYERILTRLLWTQLYDRTIDDIAIDKKWCVFDYNYLKVTSKSASLCCYDDDNSKSIEM